MPQFKPHVTKRRRTMDNVWAWTEARSAHKLNPKYLWNKLSGFGKFGVCLAVIFAGMVATPAVIALSLYHEEVGNADAWSHTSDAKVDVAVYRMESNQTVHMALSDYLTNVLAAQFTASANLSAMEAAAVAARTYVVDLMTSGAPHHPVSNVAAKHGAIVTDNGLLDLPFLTVAEQTQKYGQAASNVVARIQQAILETDGRILTYKNQPILAFTTAISAGMTRNASFALSLPYIKAVACPDDVSAPGFTHTYTFRVGVVERDLGWNLSPTSTFRVASAEKGGYVKTVTYGSLAVTGADFANKLNLASVNFILTKGNNGDLIVVTKGIGTGFGMSLYEANQLGSRGWSGEKILARFYPSTKIVSDESWLSENKILPKE